MQQRSIWSPAYIALGSNQMNPRQQLRDAINKISELSALKLIAESAFYQSEPYGPVEQDEFVNAVIAVLTQVQPDELMQLLLDIEKAMGRERDVRWGPRVIDLDLLVYGEITSDSEFLKLPHPEIAKRIFVLRPLHDIAPDLLIVGQQRVKTMLAVCEGGKIRGLEKVCRKS